MRDYQIHAETVEVHLSLFETLMKEKQEGEIIVAVGTTSCRSLESLPHVWKELNKDQRKKFSKETQLYWDDISKNIPQTQVKDIVLFGDQLQFKTEIYIYPGIPFRIIDELITNFHLPESSLLLLVGAFIDRESIMNIYNEAIKKDYRFFSF